jgi:hypothetical protein
MVAFKEEVEIMKKKCKNLCDSCKYKLESCFGVTLKYADSDESFNHGNCIVVECDGYSDTNGEE